MLCSHVMCAGWNKRIAQEKTSGTGLCNIVLHTSCSGICKDIFGNNSAPSVEQHIYIPWIFKWTLCEAAEILKGSACKSMYIYIFALPKQGLKTCQKSKKLHSRKSNIFLRFFWEECSSPTCQNFMKSVINIWRYTTVLSLDYTISSFQIGNLWTNFVLRV